MNFAPYQDQSPELERALSPPPKDGRPSLDAARIRSPPLSPRLVAPRTISSIQPLPSPSAFAPEPEYGRTGMSAEERGQHLEAFETSLPLRLDHEAMLAYLLLPPAGGVFLLLFEHKSDYVRYHAWQSSMLFASIFVLHLLISWSAVLSWTLFAVDLGLIAFLASHAYRDVQNLEHYEVPFFGRLANSFVDNEVVLLNIGTTIALRTAQRHRTLYVSTRKASRAVYVKPVNSINLCAVISGAENNNKTSPNTHADVSGSAEQGFQSWRVDLSGCVCVLLSQQGITLATMARHIKLGVLVPSSNTMVEPLTQAIIATIQDPELTFSVHFSRFRVVKISGEQDSHLQFKLEFILEAARLLAEAKVDVIGWSGTAASWLGFETDENLCTTIERETGIKATSSVLALNKILKVLDAHEMALITPYTEALNEKIRANYARIGIDMPDKFCRHLDISDNHLIAQVDDKTLDQMVSEVAADGARMVTTLCTNLSSAKRAVYWERRLPVLVLDATSTVIWEMLRLVHVDPGQVQGWGNVFEIVAPHA